MKKILKVLAVAAALSSPAAAQDIAGDDVFCELENEYRQGCVDSPNSFLNFMVEFPDSRFADRAVALAGNIYFDKKDFAAASALLQSCDLAKLPTELRDVSTLRAAESYMRLGDLKKAASWFEIIELTGGKYYNNAICGLAYIAYVEKDYDRAEKGFSRVAGMPGFADLAARYMADIFLIKGEYGKAASMSGKYIDSHNRDSESAEMYRIYGEACYNLKDYDKAAKYLDIYRYVSPSPARKALYDLGMSYYIKGIYTDAAKIFEKVAGPDDKLSQSANMQMGLSFLKLKKRNLARMAFQQAAASDFDLKLKEQAMYNYAVSVYETSFTPFNGPVAVFEKFLNLFPESRYAPRVDEYLVDVYMNTRNYAEALRSVEKIERPSQKLLSAAQRLRFLLGTEKFANGEYKEAVRWFDKATMSDPHSATAGDAAYWKAEALYALNNYNSAVDCYKIFFKLPHNDTEEFNLAHYNLAYACFNLGHYEEARRWFKAFANIPGIASELKADTYNRLGDCLFKERKFAEADIYYNRASETDLASGDYSLMKQAAVAGLAEDYHKKIKLLDKLIRNFPDSRYLIEALYEQGRAFVMLEDNKSAAGRFETLLERYPDSPTARRAAQEIGLLYYRSDNYPEAIKAYKDLIARYPGSEEARMAQRDLKSIYLDINRVDEYADYVESLPGGTNFDAGEKDSLTYVAAERAYLRGSKEEAGRSFANYLQTFPEGAFSIDAEYYLGLMAYNDGKYEDAENYLDKVLEYPGGKYSRPALLMNASIAYASEKYEKALNFYSRLAAVTPDAAERLSAQIGAARSAARINENNSVILITSEILNEGKGDAAQLAEVHYLRAAAYSENKDSAKAEADWQAISGDTRNIFGAEAAYRLAQSLFDRGETVRAADEVTAFIQAGTPHAYWMARGFILLSDIYASTGKKLDARQYLLSLRQNYEETNDGITDMINERLKQLED